MIRKILHLMIFTTAVTFTAVAQNTDKVLEVTRDTVRSNLQEKFANELGDVSDVVEFGINRRSNWFISIAGGFNAIAAEENRFYDSFIDRMKPAFQLSVGNWITPIFGLRFQTGVGELDGHYLPFLFYNIYDTDADHTDIPEAAKPYLFKDANGKEWFHRKFKYMDFGLQVMTDAVRWFSKKPRRIGLYLFGGPGFSHSFKSQGISPHNSFSFKAAAQFNFKLCEHWDIFAELHGTMVSEVFDGQIGGWEGSGEEVNRTMEGYAGLSIGVSYRFGGVKFRKYALVNPIIYENAYRRLPTPEAPVIIVKPEEALSTFTVRFLIDQHNIEADQMLNMQRVARYMEKHPDSRLSLTGYADKETAYPSYNLRLSQRRVNSVRDYMVNECKVDPKRIVTDAHGDAQRAFDEDYRWNRVVVMKIIEPEK